MDAITLGLSLFAVVAFMLSGLLSIDVAEANDSLIVNGTLPVNGTALTNSTVGVSMVNGTLATNSTGLL